MRVLALASRILLAFTAGLVLAGPAPAKADVPAAMIVQPGAGVAALTGPWRFAVGDDPRWSRPDFDDRTWESVDLKPKPQAHDADVGLAGYVPGWSARGHHGYSGFAWYRLKIDLRKAPRELALAAPTLVDSAYEVYWDGRRIGGIGNFSRTPPVAFGIHPRSFALGNVAPGRNVIAIRTWMDAAEAGSPEAGGLHVAPSLGSASAIARLTGREALATFEGYVVDAIEPLAFLALAGWALLVRRPGPAGTKSLWLALALGLTALLRANQPLLFWTSWESLHAYDALRNVIETPAVLAAWMIALRAWLAPPRAAAIAPTSIALGVALAATQLLSRTWFALPGLTSLKPLFHILSADLRLGFVAVFSWLIVWSMAARRWIAVFDAALISAFLVGIGLFAEELSQVRVKGVWFPFGIGVSRTQFAYAAAIFTLAVMIARNGRREPS